MKALLILVRYVYLINILESVQYDIYTYIGFSL